MDVIIAVLNIGFLTFIAYRIWRKDVSAIRKFFWPALLLKLIAGILLGVMYAYYYTVGDTFNYFDDGVKLATIARSDVTSYLSFLWSGDSASPVWSELLYKQPRAMFLSKITSVFCILTFDNYWIISLYLSAISFFYTWLFATKLVAFYPHARAAAILGLLFFPSVVFWSSGIIKESLAMAALYFLSFIFLKIWEKENLKALDWPFSLIAIWVLWNLKYYYVAIFLPVVVTSLIVHWLLLKVRISSLLGKILLWCFVFFIPLFLVSVLHPNFYPERLMDVVVSSYYEHEAISNSEDLIHFHSLEATPLSILKNTPLALFSGLFRPFLLETDTILQVFTALENLALLVLFVFAITQLKKMINSKYRLLLFSILVYAILLCVFLALSTPNFGTLSRYRVGFLPFLVVLITLENPVIHKLMDSKWMKNLVP